MTNKKITKKSPKTVISDDQNVLSRNMIVPEKEAECCSSSCCSKEKILKKHLSALAVLVVLVAVLGYFFKDKFIVAIVDSKPIFRFQLNQKLVSSSLGKQTLEDMIVEALVNKELKKNKVEVKNEEIDAEIEKLSQSLSGTKLEDFLKLQGMTLKSLKDQLSLRMRVEKFLQKDISITDEKISSFIKENVKTMTATTEAEKKEEAKASILQQEMQNKVQTWISDLLAKAKISRFLK